MKCSEEKKAIETMHNFINYFNENKEDGNKANLIVLGEEIEALETLLNLIEKRQKENEELKKYDYRQFKCMDIELLKGE